MKRLGPVAASAFVLLLLAVGCERPANPSGTPAGASSGASAASRPAPGSTGSETAADAPTGLAAGQSAAPPPAGPRPNIILILSDDLNPNCLGTEGNRVCRTPNFEKLAAEGVYFTHSYVPTPQCAPSRASMITGVYPDVHTVVSNLHAALPADQKTLPGYLRNAGYRCGMIGKWHLGNPMKQHPDFPDYWAVYDKKNTARDVKYRQPAIWVNGKGRTYDRFLGDVMTDCALEYIEQNRDRPFFLWLSFHEPHPPIMAHPDYPYDPASIVLPDSLNEDLAGKPAAQRNSQEHRSLFEMSNDWLRKYIAEYYSMVTCVDANVGRVIAKLRALDLAENTLVLYINDNGMMLGEHGLNGKFAILYEELVRMPIIAWQPGTLPAGVKVDELATSVDIFPTLLARAGIARPKEAVGLDLWPLMVRTGKAVTRDAVFFEYRGGEVDRPKYFEPMLGMVTARYKYTRYLKENEEELYDLQSDPHEMKNLVTDAGSAATLAELRKRVDGFKATIRRPFWKEDEFPVPPDRAEY